MKSLFIAVLLMLAIFASLGAAFLYAIDAEMTVREGNVIDRKVDQCGEDYRARAIDAYTRAKQIDGYVIHGTDCSVMVVRMEVEPWK